MAITSWTTVENPIDLADHSARHEAGGGDEISLVGLSGAVQSSLFTQDGGVIVGTGVGTCQEETGATLRASIGCPSVAEASATALVWALVFGG